MRWTIAGRTRTLGGMTKPLLLHRIDPSRNMARFYALSLEPSLFGDVAVARRWGRIGTYGSQMIELHANREAALIALERLADAKRKRGYR